MKSPASLLLPWALLAALACGGCVRSEQPLSALAEARPDPRLTGQWHGNGQNEHDADQKDMRVAFDGQGLGHLTVQKTPGGPWEQDPNVPGFFVTRTPHDSYVNVIVSDRDRKEPGPAGPTHYEFYQYRVSDDGRTLTLRGMKTDLFRKAVADGKLKGSIEKDKGNSDTGNILLQDSSGAILKFIESSPPKELFADPITATRVP